MEQAINILKKSELFRDLEERDLSGLGKELETRAVQEGETLTSLGDIATFFFVLHKGSILIALEDGKSTVMKKAGDFIGLELLSSMGIYTATLTALTYCEIVVIPRDTFLAFIQKDTPAAGAFMQAWGSHRSRIFPFITQDDIPDMDYHY